MIMQKLIEVKAECYSGYRADENPRRFYIDNMRFEIKAITDRWYQAHYKPGYPPAHYKKNPSKIFPVPEYFNMLITLIIS